MAAKPKPRPARNYRAEYERRQEKARREGFKSYAQRRKARRILDEIESPRDLSERDDDPFSEEDQSAVWRLFRMEYQKAAKAA